MYCDGSPDPTRTDIKAVGLSTNAVANAIEAVFVKNLINSIPGYVPTGLCWAGYYCPIPTTSIGSSIPNLYMT